MLDAMAGTVEESDEPVAASKKGKARQVRKIAEPKTATSRKSTQPGRTKAGRQAAQKDAAQGSSSKQPMEEVGSTTPSRSLADSSGAPVAPEQRGEPTGDKSVQEPPATRGIPRSATKSLSGPATRLPSPATRPSSPAPAEKETMPGVSADIEGAALAQLVSGLDLWTYPPPELEEPQKSGSSPLAAGTSRERTPQVSAEDESQVLLEGGPQKVRRHRPQAPQKSAREGSSQGMTLWAQRKWHKTFAPGGNGADQKRQFNSV
jgi:hypothetical protein